MDASSRIESPEHQYPERVTMCRQRFDECLHNLNGHGFSEECFREMKEILDEIKSLEDSGSGSETLNSRKWRVVVAYLETPDFCFGNLFPEVKFGDKTANTLEVIRTVCERFASKVITKARVESFRIEIDRHINASIEFIQSLEHQKSKLAMNRKNIQTLESFLRMLDSVNPDRGG